MKLSYSVLIIVIVAAFAAGSVDAKSQHAGAKHQRHGADKEVAHSKSANSVSDMVSQARALVAGVARALKPLSTEAVDLSSSIASRMFGSESRSAGNDKELQTRVKNLITRAIEAVMPMVPQARKLASAAAERLLPIGKSIAKRAIPAGISLASSLMASQ